MYQQLYCEKSAVDVHDKSYYDLGYAVYASYASSWENIVRQAEGR